MNTSEPNFKAMKHKSKTKMNVKTKPNILHHC